MKFVVFYRIKSMSVSLYANGGKESDAEEFVKIVSDKVFDLDKSNSKSDSCSLSVSGSCSCSNSLLEHNSHMFFEHVFVCDVKTGIEDIKKFEKLIEHLRMFYYVYED